MSRGLQRGVLLRGQEVGTGLGDVRQLTLSTAVATRQRASELALLSLLRQFAVAENLGVGVVRLQGLQQGPQGVLLGFGARVGRMAVGEQAALVADTDAVGVEVAGMGTDEVLVPGLVGLPVSGDVVVIAGEAEAGLVAGNERGDRVRTVFAGGTAVNDNKVYSSHGKKWLC